MVDHVTNMEAACREGGDNNHGKRLGVGGVSLPRTKVNGGSMAFTVTLSRMKGIDKEEEDEEVPINSPQALHCPHSRGKSPDVTNMRQETGALGEYNDSVTADANILLLLAWSI
ncbi:hypothetical protein ElyMa_006521700 [Elysia marginata]|uniref:Uncharacterized protein n=1 Tax=Elysia marginata TaxID=1093978 RepID=A0AAV4I504_9GAST|nr:hypothetical protein ElyMa_006521700 [Elysia marginata]